MAEPPVERILIPTQSDLAGEPALDSNVILLLLVPTAVITPSFLIYSPEFTFTVTPASILKVTPLATKTFPVTV